MTPATVSTNGVKGDRFQCTQGRSIVYHLLHVRVFIGSATLSLIPKVLLQRVLREAFTEYKLDSWNTKQVSHHLNE